MPRGLNTEPRRCRSYLLSSPRRNLGPYYAQASRNLSKHRQIESADVDRERHTLTAYYFRNWLTYWLHRLGRKAKIGQARVDDHSRPVEPRTDSLKAQVKGCTRMGSFA